MAKRREVVRKITDEAKRQGYTVDSTEGGDHTKLVIDGLKIPVSRSPQIPDNIARKLYKQAEPKLGRGWWRV